MILSSCPLCASGLPPMEGGTADDDDRSVRSSRSTQHQQERRHVRHENRQANSYIPYLKNHDQDDDDDMTVTSRMSFASQCHSISSQATHQKKNPASVRFHPETKGESTAGVAAAALVDSGKDDDDSNGSSQGSNSSNGLLQSLLSDEGDDRSSSRESDSRESASGKKAMPPSVLKPSSFGPSPTISRPESQDRDDPAGHGISPVSRDSNGNDGYRNNAALGSSLTSFDGPSRHDEIKHSSNARQAVKQPPPPPRKPPQHLQMPALENPRNDDGEDFDLDGPPRQPQHPVEACHEIVPYRDNHQNDNGIRNSFTSVGNDSGSERSRSSSASRPGRSRSLQRDSSATRRGRSSSRQPPAPPSNPPPQRSASRSRGESVERFRNTQQQPPAGILRNPSGGRDPPIPPPSAARNGDPTSSPREERPQRERVDGGDPRWREPPPATSPIERESRFYHPQAPTTMERRRESDPAPQKKQSLARIPRGADPVGQEHDPSLSPERYRAGPPPQPRDYDPQQRQRRVRDSSMPPMKRHGDRGVDGRNGILDAASPGASSLPGNWSHATARSPNPGQPLPVPRQPLRSASEHGMPPPHRVPQRSHSMEPPQHVATAARDDQRGTPVKNRKVVASESPGQTESETSPEEDTASDMNESDSFPLTQASAYDDKGRCVKHPHIRLRKKKMLGGWNVLLVNCPDCCIEEMLKLRRNNGKGAGHEAAKQGGNIPYGKIASPRSPRDDEYPSNNGLPPISQLTIRNKSNGGNDDERSTSSGSASEITYGTKTDYSRSSWMNYAHVGGHPHPPGLNAAESTERSNAGSVGEPHSGSSGSGPHRVTRMPFTDAYGERGWYTGEVAGGSGLPHGMGTMHYCDGRTRGGWWTNGLASGGGKDDGSDAPRRDEGSVGSRRSGTARDEGRVVVGMEWSDLRGNPGFFTGETDEGREPHGMGSMRYSDGGVLAGEWFHGQFRPRAPGGGSVGGGSRAAQAERSRSRGRGPFSPGV